MSQEIASRGVALRCDHDGMITEVLRDDPGQPSAFVAGRPFAVAVHRDSLGKALSFLAELRARGAATGWELNVPVGGELRTLRFAGGVEGDTLLILGAPSRAELIELETQMRATGDGDMSPADSLPGWQSDAECVSGEPDATLYDEISRLNNELINLQRRLAKQNLELERLNELMNQFLGMAAHDLRAPLSAISTCCEFLVAELGPTATEGHMELLGVMRSSSDYMAKLIEDLLDVSVIESGKLSLSLEPTAMSELMAHSAAQNRILTSRKQSSLELECEGPLPMLLVDRTKIEQVMSNLIGNAAKFSPPRSTVKVRVCPYDGGVLLSVQDQGPGVGGDDLDRLLQPFRTGTARGTRGERSAGLGLAIVKRIVEGHGGRVWVRSRDGEGATFFVFLPGMKGDMQT